MEVFSFASNAWMYHKAIFICLFNYCKAISCLLRMREKTRRHAFTFWCLEHLTTALLNFRGTFLHWSSFMLSLLGWKYIGLEWRMTCQASLNLRSENWNKKEQKCTVHSSSLRYDRLSKLYFSYFTLVFFGRADWLARGWLAKYYSSPNSRRKTKWLLSVYCH